MIDRNPIIQRHLDEIEEGGTSSSQPERETSTSDAWCRSQANTKKRTLTCQCVGSTTHRMS